MKKVLRLGFSIAILSSLTVNLLPSSGSCQMLVGGLLAKSCSMPCCKMNMPMPKCPLMKAAAPRDLIASFVPTFEDSLQPMHDAGWMALPSPRPFVTFVVSIVEAVRYLLTDPAQSVRAPPSDVHLLAA